MTQKMRPSICGRCMRSPKKRLESRGRFGKKPKYLCTFSRENLLDEVSVRFSRAKRVFKIMLENYSQFDFGYETDAAD